MKYIVFSFLLFAGAGVLTLAFPFSGTYGVERGGAEQSHAEEITIAAVGDIMLGSRAARFIDVLGVDYPFGGTAHILKSADLAFGNLEGPLGVGGTKAIKDYTFLSDPRVAEGLKRSGFDVLSLANNHTLDFGSSALSETLVALKNSDIAAVGAGKNLGEARKSAVLTVKGVRVAFLAYSLTYPKDFYATRAKPGTAEGRISYVKEDVRMARQKSDLVVASFHWGAEGMASPKDYQREVAYAAINAGASLVLGHHPHVLQGIERYKHGLVAYSLGNFAFGTYNKNKDSMILRVTFDAQGALKRATILPILVFNEKIRFRPIVYGRNDSKRVIDHLSVISRDLNTSLVFTDGIGVVEPLSRYVSER